MSHKGNSGTDKEKMPAKPGGGGHAGAGRSGTEGLGSEKPSDGLGSHTPDPPNTGSKNPKSASKR